MYLHQSDEFLLIPCDSYKGSKKETHCLMSATVNNETGLSHWGEMCWCVIKTRLDMRDWHMSAAARFAFVLTEHASYVHMRMIKWLLFS